MTMLPMQTKILKAFCDMYEGREKEIGNPLIAYGDLLIIAEQLGISIQEVVIVLQNELDKILP